MGMKYSFSNPTLGTPVLADTEFRARLKRGFGHAGGNNSSGGAHTFGYIRRGTPLGKRLSDSLVRPYGVLRSTTVDNGTQRINFPAGSECNRLFYVGDVISMVVTAAATIWTTHTVVTRTITGVDPAGLWIDVGGAALAAPGDNGMLIVLDELCTHTGAGTALTVLSPPEGVQIGVDFKTFEIPTDMNANGQLTPVVNQANAAWGSILHGHRVVGVNGAGITTEMEYLLNPGAIPAVSALVTGLGIIPPDSDGAYRFPEIIFDRYAVLV